MKKCKQCNFSWPDNIEECPVDGCREFIDVAAMPPPPPPKPLPACCPKPDCQTLLVTKGGKFCSECATRLKPVTLAVWDEKLVSPALQKDASSVLLDPSELLRAASKMGLMEDEVEAHLDESFVRLTGSSRQQLSRWVQESVIPLRGEHENPLGARQQAMEQAATLGIAPAVALKILDDLAPWETTAPEPSPAAAVADAAASAPKAEPKKPEPVADATAVDVTNVPAQPPGEELAKQAYANFLRGFKVSPEPIFLKVESGSSIADTLGGNQVFLNEHSQGAMVLFLNTDSGDSGWVYPNINLHYREEALRKVFPALTEFQFITLKHVKSIDGSNVRPVAVKRLDSSRWMVASGGNAASVDVGGRSARTATTTTPPKTPKPATPKPATPKPATPEPATDTATTTTRPGEKEEAQTLSDVAPSEVDGGNRLRLKRILGAGVVGIVVLLIAWVALRDTTESKMEGAIKQGRLVKPLGASAYDHFRRLKAEGLSDSKLAALSEKLLPVLLPASQKMLDEAYQPGGRRLSGADWEETTRLVEWAGELKPQDRSLAAKADYCKGQSAYLRGDAEAATKFWRRAVELDTEWALPSHSLSLLYHRAGKYTLERGCLVEASRRDPDWAIPYVTMGDWFAKVKKDSAMAESFYRKAAERAPRWATPHAALADMAMRKRDYNTAIRELELALNASADVDADLDLEKLKRDLAYARRSRSKR